METASKRCPNAVHLGTDFLSLYSFHAAIGKGIGVQITFAGHPDAGFCCLLKASPVLFLIALHMHEAFHLHVGCRMLHAIWILLQPNYIMPDIITLT